MHARVTTISLSTHVSLGNTGTPCWDSVLGLGIGTRWGNTGTQCWDSVLELGAGTRCCDSVLGCQVCVNMHFV
jgi:hypothetical protein